MIYILLTLLILLFIIFIEKNIFIFYNKSNNILFKKNNIMESESEDIYLEENYEEINSNENS